MNTHIRVFPFVLQAALCAGCATPDPEDSTASQPGDSGAPSTALHIQVELASGSLVADGLSETTATLQVRTADDSPAPEGTVVHITSDLGQVLQVDPVADGVAALRFKAGTWPGTATLSSSEGILSGETTITLLEGGATSAQLHLHGSISEGNASMAEQTVAAETQGIDLLWWTDHDVFYNLDGIGEYAGYDFEGGSTAYDQPTWPSGVVMESAWELESSALEHYASSVIPEAAYEGQYGWRLQGTAAAGQHQLNRWVLVVSPNFNFKPLFADVSFGFAFRPNTPGGLLCVSVPINASLVGHSRQGEYIRVHFHWGAGGWHEEDTELNKYVELEGQVGQWNVYQANLSELVGAWYPELSLDVHGEMVDVEIHAEDGANADFDLDAFWWRQEVKGEDLRALQREYLATLPNDTLHLVGTEVSPLAGWHLNVFGSDVPFLPYTEVDDLDPGDVAEFVHEHGGIIALNHPFGTSGTLVAGGAVEERKAEIIAELTAAEGYGCDLLEVGYRQRMGNLEDHLEIWDTLGASGILLTGLGTSDLHDDHDWDEYYNNFVTWVVGAGPSEPDLLWNLRRGAAFFGDPSYFSGAEVWLSLTAPEERASMGQVVQGRQEPLEILFAAEPLLAGWEVHAVLDGQQVATWTVEQDGWYDTSLQVDPTAGGAIRFEVYDPQSGEGLLFSNPIYFMDDGMAVPEERMPAP